MSDFYLGNVSLHRLRTKHRCPKCGGPLKVVTEEKTVCSPGRESRLNSANDMKTYNTFYKCPLCRMKYTARDMQRIAKKMNKDYLL